MEVFGLGCRVWDEGFEMKGMGCGNRDLGFRVQDLVEQDYVEPARAFCDQYRRESETVARCATLGRS